MLISSVLKPLRLIWINFKIKRKLGVFLFKKNIKLMGNIIYRLIRSMVITSLVFIVLINVFFDFYPRFWRKKNMWQEVNIDLEKMERDVRFLNGLKRSYMYREDLDKTVQYLKNSLSELGYNVTEQKFSISPQGDNLSHFSNVIVSYGNDNAKEMIVVGAHYDTFDAFNNPGADDNASAVAGLLEIARLLKKHNPDLNKRIDMVFYANEEPPFFGTKNMGSYHHAQKVLDSKPTVAAMIALEMIGYFSDYKGSQKYPFGFMRFVYGDIGNFIAVVGNLKARKLVHKVHKGLSSTPLPSKLLVAPSFTPGIMFSDHINYADNIPSVMITDTAFYRNPNYHKNTDTPETLDYERMGLPSKAYIVLL